MQSLSVPLSSPAPLKPYSLKPTTTSKRFHATTATATDNMYDLLSVRENAAPEEIKAAFKKQARRWHPDLCPPYGDKSLFAERFVEARKAYEVLSDPVLRTEYDAGLCEKDCCGFGDWRSQLEGLEKRSASRADAGGRRSSMRRSQQTE